MGIDTSFHFGLGYRIDKENLQELIDDEVIDAVSAFDYIRDNLDHQKYEYFEIGNGRMTGDLNTCCIVVKNPFEDGFTGAFFKAAHLFGVLDMLKIKTIGSVDVFGGEEVY